MFLGNISKTYLKKMIFKEIMETGLLTMHSFYDQSNRILNETKPNILELWKKGYRIFAYQEY